MHKAHWKALLILLTLAVAGGFLYPSAVFYSKPRLEQDSLRVRRNTLVNKILNLGLDLQGGIHLLLELQTDKLADDRPETLREAMDRAMEVIRNRIDAYGLSEPLLVKQGDRWIVVQLPGVKDQEQAKDLIGKTALLEFRIVETGGSTELYEKARSLGLSANELVPGRMPEAIRPLLPPGTELLKAREEERAGYYLVRSSRK